MGCPYRLSLASLIIGFISVRLLREAAGNRTACKRGARRLKGGHAKRADGRIAPYSTVFKG